MNKKALEPSSTLMMVILFIVILAIILILAFKFGKTTNESGIFQYATDWKSAFRW